MNGNSQMPVMGGRLGFMPLQLPPPPPQSLYSLANGSMGRGAPYRGGFNRSFRGPNPRFNQPFRGQHPRGGFNQGFRGRPLQKRKSSEGMDGGDEPAPKEQNKAAGGSAGSGEDCQANFYLPEGGAATGGENPIYQRRQKPWQNKAQRANDGEPKPQLRCELCDLPLTSVTHAEQHYKGRRHRLVASNVSKPSGAGYYNADGKWVRTATKFMPTVAPDGRFGIGEAFKKADDADSSSEAQVPEKIVPDELCCKVCKITVTSKAHMDMHLVGSKHAKKLKQLGLNPIATVDETQATRADKTILAALAEGGEAAQDYSTYRTPAGGYYCKVCDLQLTHVMGLKQHLEGKKHQRNVSMQFTQATAKGE